MVRNKAYKT